MASTPATSFSSDNNFHEGSSPPPLRAQPSHPTLPSPSHTASDSETDARTRRVQKNRDVPVPESNRQLNHGRRGESKLEVLAPKSPSDDTISTDSPHSSTLLDTDDTISSAYKVIWDSFCGLPVPHYPTFHLDQTAYEKLRDELDTHPALLQFFDETLRKDWDAETLTLRLMPTRIHDHFLYHTVKLVEKKLDQLAETQSDSGIREYHNKISGSGTSDVIEVKDGKQIFVKSPDGQWLYEGQKDPCLVVEVGYSQEERRLANAAKQFLVQMPGMTVIVCDLDYSPPADRLSPGHTHCASVGAWTSAVTMEMRNGRLTKVRRIRCVRKPTLFRNQGQAVPGQLDIPFELFCPVKQRATMPTEVQNLNISLRFDELTALMEKAEDFQRLNDDPPPRSRSPTPDDVLSVTEFVEEDGTVSDELPWKSCGDLKRQLEESVDEAVEPPIKKMARLGPRESAST